MRYIATIILVLTTASLIFSGILLWRRRGETGDFSRYIHAVLSWVSAFFAATFLFRTWAETTTADGALFEPEHTFIPLIAQMTFFLYPLEVIKPAVSKAKVYAFLFVPLMSLLCIGMFAGIEYTTINTYTDLWQHIWEPNVLFRLVTLTVMLFYAFALFLVPYNWNSSTVSRKFILTYALGFMLIGVFHFLIQITHSYLFIILHQLTWITFFLAVARYELKERLVAAPEADGGAVGSTASSDAVEVATKAEVEDHPQADELWKKILSALEYEQQWRNPELTLTALCQQVCSNRTYVCEAFKRNAGFTFSEYMSQKRIGYVVSVLKENPNTYIKDLFHYVGYRSRTAGWENFHKVTGVSPSEFIANL